MIEGLTITFAGILQAGAGGLVTLVVLMMFTGRLISRKQHDERVNDAKEQATTWRAAYETSEKSRRENESLVREQLETTRMVLHLVRTLRSVVADSDETSSDVADAT